MKNTILHQIKINIIAIISLIVAISALYYNTWRNELTEKNRNTRTAAFQLLKELDELQIVINYEHYQSKNRMDSPFLGWGHIAFINDLSELLPSPIRAKVELLTQQWNNNWTKIKMDEEALDRISIEIDHSRKSVLSVLRQLK